MNTSISRTKALPYAILTLFTLALLLPFINKAFHIDDTLFMWVAQHIQTSPSNPYGFETTWYLDRMWLWQITKNPPLASYYIALVALAVGWGERSMHLAFLLPATAVALGTFVLARRSTDRPLLAGVLAVSTPVFLISGSLVMCDMLMLAFWTWAVILWIRGIDNDDHVSLALSAVLIAVSALTKYYGMCLILLLPVYALAKKRRIGLWLMWMLIPLAALFWYQWTTEALYGRGLLLDAGNYATRSRTMRDFELSIKGLTGLAFTGGCMAGTFFFIPFLWRARYQAINLALFAAILFGLSRSGSILHFSVKGPHGIHWSQLVQFAALAITGINILALSVCDLWRRKINAISILLFCWVAGTFVFASYVNWTVNARSLLPLLPAAGILLARRFDERYPGPAFPRILLLPTILASIVALIVAYGDFSLANSTRMAAEKITEKYGGSEKRLWYQGHWGFQYYMNLKGFNIAERTRTHVRPGDLVVIPENNALTYAFPPDREFHPVETLEVPSCRWISTMNRHLGAGFYASRIGPLPFFFGPIPPERYNIIELIKDGTMSPSPASMTEQNDAMSLIATGDEYMEKDDIDTAIVYYSNSLRLLNQNVGAFFKRGKALNKKGDYDKAISDFTQTILVYPYHAEVYNQRGHAYFLKGEYPKAVSDFTMGIMLDPEDPGLYYNRAFARFEAGDISGALSDVLKSREMGLNIDKEFLKRIRKARMEQ